MRIGIVVTSGDPWRFFKDIYEDLQNYHIVSLFQRRNVASPIFNARINRHLFHRDLERFLEQNDVVFFEWASDLLAAATRLPKRTRIVTRLHRYEMFQWTSQINWANVDRVILVSHAMQEKFARRFPEFAHKTIVIPESVDVQKFQAVDKPYRGDIGTLCFLAPRKRVYELILTFAELNERQPGLTLHLGGSNKKSAEYYEALHSLVLKLNLQSKVKFYGDVTEPWNWYSNIDIFVSNSYSEGLQVAPMEAMASARYTLSHHWDGAEELLPADHLFLTDSQLQNKILTYADLPEVEKRQKQAQMRAITCEKFDIEQIKVRIRKVVEEVGQTVKA